MHTALNSFIKVTKIVDAIFEYIARICVYISGILLVIVTLVIFAGVINRSFIGWVWVFVEEWSTLALIPISYLVMGYTLRLNRHLRVDILVSKLSNRWQNIFMIFAVVFSLICLGFMIEASADWFLYTYKNQTTSFGPMRTPLWIFSGSILFGLSLFTIDMILLLANRFFALLYGVQPLKFIDE